MYLEGSKAVEVEGDIDFNRSKYSVEVQKWSK